MNRPPLALFFDRMPIFEPPGNHLDWAAFVDAWRAEY
jgi:hypothetical protein